MSGLSTIFSIFWLVRPKQKILSPLYEWFVYGLIVDSIDFKHVIDTGDDVVELF